MNIRDKLIASATAGTLNKQTLETSKVDVWIKPASYLLKLTSQAMLSDPKVEYKYAFQEIQKQTFLSRVCDKDGVPIFASDDWDELVATDGKLIDEIFVAVGKADAATPEEPIKEVGNASGQTQSAALSSESA